MTVEQTRQLAEDVVACVEVLDYLCTALEAQDGVSDPGRFVDAAANVAQEARGKLDELRGEIDNWEFTVGLNADYLDIDDDEDDDEDDVLAAWA